MSDKLPTEHHLEFLSLKGGCPGSSESTLVKMPHCWKSDVAAQLCSMLCTYQVVARVSLNRNHILTLGLTFMCNTLHNQTRKSVIRLCISIS